MYIHNRVRLILIVLSIGFATAAILNEINLMNNSTALSLIFNLAAVFFICIHYCLIPPQNKKKFSRLYLFYAAILYLVFLLSLLFIDPEFSRDLLFNDIKNRYNFIPLHTIMLYINGYKKGVLLLSELIINLLGNFIAFMPFGFFLPRLFRKLNNIFLFIFTTAVFIITVEIMQFTLRSGVCDIDDLILNLSGAVLIYLFQKKL